MIKGARERKQRAEKSKDRAKLFAFSNGMQTFPDAIAKQLGERIMPNCEVFSITRDNVSGQFSISFVKNGTEQTESADIVVLASPSSAASKMVGSLSTKLPGLLRDIYYPPVAEVFLGFRNNQLGRPLDGFGYLIPAKEKRKILGTIWSSALFPHRAPEGHAAVVSFVGGSRQPELASLSESELVSLVTGELQSIMNVIGTPVFSKVVRWQKAIPQYNLGYQRIVEAMEGCENANPGLFFCSNFKGGIAVGDCVMNGKKVSDKILQMRIVEQVAV
jgi:protoporphyrinogen/coproporphyrinogen III oxidase